MKLLKNNVFPIILLLAVILAVGFFNTPTNPLPRPVPSGIKVAYAIEDINRDFSHVSGDIYIYSIDKKTTTKIYHYDFRAQNPPDISQQTNSYNILPVNNDSMMLHFNLSGEVFTKLIGLDGVEKPAEQLKSVLQEDNDFFLLNQNETLLARPQTDFNKLPPKQNPIIIHNITTGRQRLYPVPNTSTVFIPWHFSDDNKYLYIQKSDESNQIYVLNISTGDMLPISSTADLTDISLPTPSGMVAMVKEGEYIQIDPATQSDFPTTTELFLVDLNKDKSALLVSAKDSKYSIVALSPDAKTLFFSQSDATSPEFKNTYMMDTTNPTNIKKVFDFVVNSTKQSWSQDGKTVLLQPNPNQYYKNSFLFDIETNKKTNIPRTNNNLQRYPTNIIGLFE